VGDEHRRHATRTQEFSKPPLRNAGAWAG
jgi:hypothetical protein